MARIYRYGWDALFSLAIPQLKRQLTLKGVEYDHNHRYTKEELVKKLWKLKNKDETVRIVFGEW